MQRAILFFVSLTCFGIAGAQAEPSFSYKVSGCAETKTGMVTQTRSPQKVVEPMLEAVASGIRYFRAGMHQCCRKVEFHKTVQKQSIVLTEFWTGKGCRCMCFSQIEAAITNLPPGEYDVTVYSAGIDLVTYTNIVPKEILSQKMKIGAAVDAEVIRFGVPRSTLIVSGRLQGTLAGGGGATSTVDVDKVFTSPAGYKIPGFIAVYWHDSKPMQPRDTIANTNLFLFFLRPEKTNGPTGYSDVTQDTHPFVCATDANVRLVESELQAIK